MNTIPTIFNQRQVDYTVLGGAEEPEGVAMPVTCLVLNRHGNQYRSYVLENLAGMGFARVVSIMPSGGDAGLDAVSRLYPAVKFVVAREDVTPGDMLNIGMAESVSPYVLVLQDDLCTEGIRFSAPTAEKLMERRQFCVCPKLLTSSLQVLPVRFAPVVDRSVLSVDSSLGFTEGERTLYAADLAGLYDRDKFMRLGGADYTIASPYWQKMDLFFRAWLWGEEVGLDGGLEFSYADELPEEDQTVDYSYLRFYLKNLAPVYRNDHAEIPWKGFLAFKSRNLCSFGESVALFRDARRWTRDNRYRFKVDAAALIEQWGKP